MTQFERSIMKGIAVFAAIVFILTANCILASDTSVRDYCLGLKTNIEASDVLAEIPKGIYHYGKHALTGEEYLIGFQVTEMPEKYHFSQEELLSSPPTIACFTGTDPVTGDDFYYAFVVTEGVPAGYYDTVDTSTPELMRSTLHEVINDHQRFPYTSSGTDTWDILELAEQDPNDSGNIIDVYKNFSYDKIGGGVGPYNREHTWPKSYGFPDDYSTCYPHTDCHMLMLCDSSYNSSRSNNPYGTCDASCAEYRTWQGLDWGSIGVYPGDSDWRDGSSIWEVWWGRRGDVARALLYMDVRYEGGTHGVTGYAEPNLILTDDVGLLQVVSDNVTGDAYMARLSTLLQWHRDDPVDDWERNRNDVVFSYQGNRNPFIDHEEWVACIFEGDCSLFSDGFESGDFSGWSTVIQ